MKIFEINPPITVVARTAPDLPGMLATEREFTVKSLTIKTIIDDRIKKQVSVSFLETPCMVKIWSDSDYDLLGDWTQQQLEDAVFMAIKSNPLKVVTELLTFPTMFKFDENMPPFNRQNDILKQTDENDILNENHILNQKILQGSVQ
jgi:hypothetical protein